MFCFEPASFGLFLRDVSFDFITVGVVISQGRVNLCERQVADARPDLLGRVPQLIPSSDASDRDTCPGNVRRPPCIPGVRVMSVPMSVAVAMRLLLSCLRYNFSITSARQPPVGRAIRRLAFGRSIALR